MAQKLFRTIKNFKSQDASRKFMFFEFTKKSFRKLMLYMIQDPQLMFPYRNQTTFSVNLKLFNLVS